MRWTVDRQELVLFHARHKRLRFFYEDIDAAIQDGLVGPEFSRYRKHVQQLLGTLREVLESFPKGAEVSVHDNNSAPTEPQNNECILRLGLPANINRRIFIAYLVYWRLCLIYEGWKEGSAPYTIISTLITNIEEHNNHEIPPIEVTVNHLSTNDQNELRRNALFRSTLIHLASSLPIMPHWDTWGNFSKDSNRTDTLLGKIKDCSNPIYATQLKYKSPDIPDDAPSKKLLGYSARLRACYSESDPGTSSTVFVSEDDYYRYCHDPDGHERELYRAYGLLIDALNIALHGKRNEDDDAEKVLFYIAYRIRTSLGRYHFWHIWLSPDPADPNPTLEQLWASWWPLHQRILDWPTLHVSLATELEQLDIAYAQEGFLDAIKTRTSNGKQESEQSWLNELVCEHGHMLFPALCFCIGGKRKWGYVPYYLETLPEIREVLAGKEETKAKLVAGAKWQPPSKSSPNMNSCCDGTCRSRDKNKQGDTILFKEYFPGQTLEPIGQTNDLSHILLHQRYRRLVDQQRFLVEQMLGARGHQIHMSEQERERVRETLRRALTSRSPWPKETLAAVDHQRNWREHPLLADDNEAPKLEHRKLTKAGEIADCLFGNDNPRHQLVVLLSGGLHVFLSGILELHPVKGYTHSMPDSETSDFLKDWTRERVSDVLINYSGWFSQTGASNSYDHFPELKEHLGKVNAALKNWQSDSWLEATPQTANSLKLVQDDSTHPAANLIGLREKDSDAARDAIAKVLGNKAMLITNPSEMPDGSNAFRASLPMSVVFLAVRLSEFSTFIQRKASEYWFRIFGLPHSRDDPWRPVLFRNYLAIAYTTTSITGTPPAVFDKVDNHLKSFGGRLFVVFKKKHGLVWNTVNHAGNRRVYFPINRLECWPDRSDRANGVEYSLLFEDERWNTVVLWTFDGYYMREG